MDSSKLIEYSLKLLQAIKNEGVNLIISPISIQVQLGMLLIGSKSTTCEELKKCLQIDLDSTEKKWISAFINSLNHIRAEDLKKRIKNLISVQQIVLDKSFSLDPNYENAIQEKFRCSVAQMDLGDTIESALAINTWMEKETGKQISNFMSKMCEEISYETHMILVDAISFQGQWGSSFTQIPDGDFKLSSGKVKKVKMFEKMECLHAWDASSDELQAQCVKIPLDNSHMSLMILLPTSGTINDLKKRLTTVHIQQMMSELDYVNVHIEIPLINKLENKLDIKIPLKELGVKNLFDSSKADLSGISSQGNLSLQHFFHKVIFSMGEPVFQKEGVKAKKVTMKMTVNRPFLMFVCDSIIEGMLFMAQVNDPS